nr:hypothetical protein Iba_chr05cCG17950 [Ipomoea batatas]
MPSTPPANSTASVDPRWQTAQHGSHLHQNSIIYVLSPEMHRHMPGLSLSSLSFHLSPSSFLGFQPALIFHFLHYLA